MIKQQFFKKTWRLTKKLAASLFALALLSPFDSVAQENIWVKSAGQGLQITANNDEVKGVAKDANGNVYVVGNMTGTVTFGATTLVAGDQDVFIAKYNDAGVLQWVKNIGGTSVDGGTGIAVDASGVYITGFFQGTADFDPGAAIVNLSSSGSNDIFFARYDLDGNYSWAKRIGGTASDQGLGITIDATHIYLTGFFSGSGVDFDPTVTTVSLTSTGNSDVFFAKYNLAGTITEWAKNIGGTLADQGNTIAVDASAVYIGGYFTGNTAGTTTADFDPGASSAPITNRGSQDLFLAQYDISTGNYIWAKTAGGAGSFNDIVNSLVVTGGHIYATGVYQGTNVDFDAGIASNSLSAVGGSDIFIMSYDVAGNHAWAKSIGASNGDVGNGIATDGTDLYVTGYFSAAASAADFDPSTGNLAPLTSAGLFDAFIGKYTLSGTYTWARNIGSTGSDQGNSIAVDGVDVYVGGSFSNTADFDPAAGTSVNRVSGGGTDLFVGRYDLLAGNYVWANTAGNGIATVTNNDQGRAMTKDASGNIYVTGGASYTFSFSGSTFTSAGDLDVFIAKYDPNGNLLWVKSMGGASADNGNAIAVDGSAIYITGSFTGTADFDPGAGTATLTNSSAAAGDVFVAKYTLDGNYQWAFKIGSSSANLIDQGNAIAVDATGVYVGGYFSGTADFNPDTGTATNLTTAGSNDMFIAKYTFAGVYQWAYSIGGSGGATPNDMVNSMATDGTGVYVTGYIQSTSAVDFDPTIGIVSITALGGQDAFMAKYDQDGGFQWVKQIGGSSNEVGYGIAVDGSNIYLTGVFQGTTDFDLSSGAGSWTATGGSDAFLAKYDLSGNYVWANKIGGVNGEQGNAIAIDGTSIYLTGYFQGTSDFNPTILPGFTLTSAGVQDIFLAQYTLNGAFVTANRMGGTGTDNGNGLVVDASGIYMTGSFSNTNVDFDPTCTLVLLNSTGGTDIYVGKYTKEVAGVAFSSPAVAAANVMAGTSNHPIYAIQLDVTNTNAVIKQVAVTTAGTYQTADLATNPFKIYYSSDETFDASDVMLSNKAAVTSGSKVTFNGMAQSIAPGSGYLFVTVDLSQSAVAARTISIAAVPLLDITLCSGTKSGSMGAAGTQTFVRVAYANTSIGASGDGLTSSTPKKTLAEATAIVPDAGTVSIEAGIYNETATLTGKAATFVVTGGAPAIIQNLVMNGAGKTLTVSGTVHISEKLALQAGTVASGGNITLLSTAAQTALIDDFSTGYTGNITGNVTVQRYFSGIEGHRYLATPVIGPTVAVFGAPLRPAYYNEAQVTAAAADIDAGWVILSNPATALNPIIGYTAYYPAGTNTLAFTGTVNTGNYSRTVTRTNSGSFTGYNVLGNPYPSPISWTALWNLNNNSNIHKSVYVWNNATGKAGIYNLTSMLSVNGGKDELAQGQSFRIRVNTIGYSSAFNLNNTIRMATSTNTYLRTESAWKGVREKLRLLIRSQDNKESYETVIYSMEDATEGIDAAYDAELPGDKGMLTLYSTTGNANMMLNALPLLKDLRSVSLGVGIAKPGMYTLEATEIENFSHGTAFYLEDRKLGKLIDLSADRAYQVQLNQPEANRFFIHFGSQPEENENVISSFVNVHTEDGEVVVQFADPKAARGTITVINLLGQTVAELSNEQQVARLKVNQPAGTYIVRVVATGGVLSKKVSIK